MDSLFSSRTMRAQFGTQSLVVDTTLGGLLYDVLPDGPGSNDRGYFQVIYQSPVSLNLLADGATSFEARFALREFGPTFGPLEITVVSSSGTDTVSGYFRSSDATSIRFDFSRFDNVNLGSVTQLRFSGWRIPEGSSFVLTSLNTVPEPTGPWVITLAAMVFLRHRRVRR